MRKSKAPILSLWLTVLAAIPVLSVFGRRLQHWIRSAFDTRDLALFVGLPTLSLIGVWFFWFYFLAGKRGLIHLFWVIPLFIVYPLTFPIVEERIHFLVFGSLGFLSVFILSPMFATVSSLGVAFLDEALQWALPDRVGDWRDIGVNCVACLGGAALAYFGKRRLESGKTGVD